TSGRALRGRLSERPARSWFFSFGRMPLRRSCFLEPRSRRSERQGARWASVRRREPSGFRLKNHFPRDPAFDANPSENLKIVAPHRTTNRGPEKWPTRVIGHCRPFGG